MEEKTDNEKVDSTKVYDEIFAKMFFYVNEADTTLVLVEYANLDNYYEFRSVNDPKFKAFVRMQYRLETEEDEAPSFQGILQKYIDDAMYDENTIQVFSRMGGNSEETAYYMGDKCNRIILINSKGHKILKRTKTYKFLKSANTKAQVIPEYGHNLCEVIFPFLNMDDDMKILFVVNLVQEFICTSSHFLAVISSPQGSGKSTFTNMWRKIVDPAQAVITTMPETADSLKTHLANNLMVCFDNTQTLNSTYSDILCGAVTGTSYTKRKLYTDNNEVVMKLHNIIVLNGIDVIPKKSDLLERSILFRLNKISEENRKGEEEIRVALEEALPKILGAIFDTLVKYFQVKDDVKIVGSHRMSGAYKDCYIIATILGVEEEFLTAFKANQELMQEDYIETNPVVSAVVSYMADIRQKQKKGTVSMLYDEIREYSDKSKFPKSPSAFSRELNAQKSALENAGFNCSIIKGRDNSSLLIKKVGVKKKNE